MSEGELQNGDRIGNFVIERPLASGGMGTVYLATDNAGRRVALKSVKSADASQLISLRREIRALLQVDHPSVVKVVEHGLYEAVPWFAMEYIEGASLQSHIYAPQSARGSDDETARLDGMETRVAGASTVSVDDKETDVFARHTLGDLSASAPTRATRPLIDPAQRSHRDIRPLLIHMAHVLRALGFMHSAGIVHRDLKPENIVIRHSDGRAVLVDFGIAAANSDDKVTQAREVAGTPAYISPEQALGERVDARADLYSVGCMLFEIVAGHTPFRGSSAFEMIDAHVRAEIPTAPCSDPELAELIRHMMAKRPIDRPAFALDAARRLEEILGLEHDEPQPDPYLCRPSFQGRDELLRRARKALEAAKEGKGGVYLMVGPRGSGKTRFANELTHLAASDPHLATTIVDVTSTSGSNPFGIALAEVVDRCRERGPEFTRRVFGSHAGVLAKQFESLLELPGLEVTEADPDLPQQFEHMRRTRAWTDVLCAAYPGKSIVMVVDEFTPKFEGILQNFRALQMIEPTPIALFVTIGEENVDIIEDTGKDRILELEPLSHEEVSEVIRSALGVSSVPDALGDEVSRLTRGNPAAITRALERALEAGLVIQGRRGQRTLNSDIDLWREIFATSSGARMREAIAQLPPEASKLLHCIALVPEGLAPSVLERLLDTRSDLAALDTALSAHDLELKNGRIAFRDSDSRDAVLGTLSDQHQRELRLEAAAALEAAGFRTSLARARLLAESGRSDEARTIYLELIEAPDARTDERMVLKEYLATDPPPTRQKLKALRRYSQLNRIGGHGEESIRTIRLTIELARELGDDLIETLATIELASDLLMAGEDHAELGTKALAMAEKTGDPEALCRAYSYLGAIAMFEDDVEKDVENYARAHRSVPRSERYLWMLSGSNYGSALIRAGRLHEARGLLESLLNEVRGLSMPRAEGYILLNLASVIREYGNETERSLKLAEEAESIFTELSDRGGIRGARVERMLTLVRMRRYEEVLELGNQGTILEFEFNLMPDVGTRARTILFCALLGLGRLREAESVVESLQISGLDFTRWRGQLLRARIERRKGNYDDAERILNELLSEPDLDFEHEYCAEIEEVFLSVARGGPLPAEPPAGDEGAVVEYAAELRLRLLETIDAAATGKTLDHGEAPT